MSATQGIFDFHGSSPAEKSAVDEQLKTALFVIPSINGGDLLAQMLPTLRIPPQIVVVLDQGSTDDTGQVCASHGVSLVQLNSARTYTECCNMALRLAVDRGCEFLFIANNDITFVTDVARELLFEMMRDRLLGILSCSQLIVDRQSDRTVLSNRVYWNLEITDFEHDLSDPAPNAYRIESDFCELTCAVLRVPALSAIGGFDDGFGFYHEDADVSFRLREAGYTCAYLPQSQFKHFAGSTFSKGQAERRLAYIANSRSRFTKKHLGFGLRYVDHRDNAPTSWNVVNQNLYPYMKRFGLIDMDQPELGFAHPGIESFGCLYSVWETSRLPAEWLAHRDSYRSTYLPSRWNADIFVDAGFRNVSYVPLGVETDTFHPWGHAERSYDAPTFLWFARNQFRKGFDIMAAAWHAFHKLFPAARLIVIGHGVLPTGGSERAKARQWRKTLILDDEERGISYREIISPLSGDEIASIYRGVDYLVLTSRSEGFGFSVVEAMACGVVTVFPNYGSTRDMCFEGAITFGGTPSRADYGDKGFKEVGHWWEPDPADVVRAMIQAIDMDTRARTQHLRNAFNLVRGRFTWRTTCFSIRKDIARWERRRQIDYRYAPRAAAKDVVSIAEFCLDLERNQRGREFTVSRTTNPLLSLLSEFDADYYAKEYDDIRGSRTPPLLHYLTYGWQEERRPSGLFSTRNFLAANAGARRAILVIHGLVDDPARPVLLAALEALRTGTSAWPPEEEVRVPANPGGIPGPEPAKAREAGLPAIVSQAIARDVQNGNDRPRRPKGLSDLEYEAFAVFDHEYYMKTYPDVAEEGHNALDHYLKYGWAEDRRPSLVLDTASILRFNPIARRVMLERLAPEIRLRGHLPVGDRRAGVRRLLGRLGELRLPSQGRR